MKYCFRIHDWHLFLSVFWSFYYHSGFPCCWGINCLSNCNFSWQSIAGGVSASLKMLYFLTTYGFTIVYLSINLFLCFSYLGFLEFTWYVDLCFLIILENFSHCYFVYRLSMFLILSTCRYFRLIWVCATFADLMLLLSVSSDCSLFFLVICDFLKLSPRFLEVYLGSSFRPARICIYLLPAAWRSQL